MSRRTVRIPKKTRERFLEGLRQGMTITEAARSAGVSRTAVYTWRLKDKRFAEEWERALDEGTDKIEAALIGKALKMDSPASVTAAIFLLKARRPEYRDARAVEVGGGETRIVVEFVGDDDG